MKHFVVSISFLKCFPDEYSLAHHAPSVSTVADLKKRRRVRAKDHLFLIIR